MIGNLAVVLFDGFAFGMLLFVLSVGLSVTLGLMNFTNLAHGAFGMLGGYAVVVQRLHEEDLGRLFEFDKDLSLTASFSLTAEQVRAASVEAQREPR